MNVHSWIVNDLESMRSKLNDSVLSVVPTGRWVEQVDNGGSSIAHLLLHVARHQDLAVATAIRNHPPLFEAHCAALGLDDARPSAGLPEREDPAVSNSLALDTIPDTSHRLVDKAGLAVDDVDWLHRMWTGKPVWWLVQWPVVGHGHAHVGEAISIRNRMGLSPF